MTNVVIKVIAISIGMLNGALPLIAADLISAIGAPVEVVPGETATVSVSYEASSNREIELAFRMDSEFGREIPQEGHLIDAESFDDPMEDAPLPYALNPKKIRIEAGAGRRIESSALQSQRGHWRN